MIKERNLKNNESMKYTETNQSSDEDGDGEQQNILSI
jgi:hypothetical protein